MHLLPHVPDGLSQSAILLVKESELTVNASSYIRMLRKQHILVSKEKDTTTFSVEALIALRSYSNVTSILGMCLVSSHFCFM